MGGLTGKESSVDISFFQGRYVLKMSSSIYRYRQERQADRAPTPTKATSRRARVTALDCRSSTQPADGPRWLGTMTGHRDKRALEDDDDKGGCSSLSLALSDSKPASTVLTKLATACARPSSTQVHGESKMVSGRTSLQVNVSGYGQA